MQKLILLVLFSSFVFASSFAQNSKAYTYYLSGIAYKNKSKFPEAHVAFKKAISLDKKLDSAYVEIGFLNMRTSKYDSASYNFYKALSINREYVMAYYGLGLLFRDSKAKYDSSILCFSMVLGIDSTRNLRDDSIHRISYYSIAWCYNTLKNYDKAIYYAAKALEVDNNYRPAYGELGHAFHASQKYEEAVIQFKKNIAISPVDLSIFYLGMVYNEMKNKEAAWQQVEALKPLNPRLAESLKKNIEKSK